MVPDDSGSDAFQRYCYQAHVAFPFCLDCALGGSVVSVVAEHVEDLGIERAEIWQFIQVKTRNANLGPWRLRDMTEPGGALRSALRTHRAIGEIPATVEIHLEGSLRRGDDIEMLHDDEGRRDAGLRTKLQEALSIDVEECNDLLSRLRLRAEVPSRDSIAALNLRTLGAQAPHLSHSRLCEVYIRVVAEIYAAMALDRLEPQWIDAVFDPEKATPDARQRFFAKRLTKERIYALIAPVTGVPRQLLKRIVDPGNGIPSVLEQKLLVGGAPDAIAESAKSLRANASIREYEYLASSIGDQSSILDDVRERLRILVEAREVLYESSERPAVSMWNDLLSHLPNQVNMLDRSDIFGRDPYLLLGEICQMADLCFVDWGRANAQ